MALTTSAGRVGGYADGGWADGRGWKVVWWVEATKKSVAGEEGDEETDVDGDEDVWNGLMTVRDEQLAGESGVEDEGVSGDEVCRVG
jgi:hypothetical protein